MSEGIVHRKVKEQVAHALQTTPGVTNVEIEWRFGPVQADVSFCLGGNRGAVEIQLSDKTRAEIDYRTQCYHELGVYVIWVLHEERTLCEGSGLGISDWEEYLHALYFGVVYHWAGGQLLQPLCLERRRNPNRWNSEKKRDRWDSHSYEQIRTLWFLDQMRITDLSPKVRRPGQFGHYTLPAAHLWCLPWETLKEAHQKQHTSLEDWPWRVFTPPMQE